ncbi:MAG: D-aminoacyl-tRNA deacylase [Christensenellaceae bacterium]|jgi:D-tyrosyl-tRNA(Tyr) deacylase
MRAVVTRVTSASVSVEEAPVAEIEHGLLVLLGAEDGDTEKDISYIAEKVIHLRIFEDEQDKMNCSLLDVGGEILLVSQFTLLGDARKGRRPSFTKAGSVVAAKEIFEKTVAVFEQTGVPVKTGVFQAEMQVASVNDGPVTMLLDSRKTF